MTELFIVRAPPYAMVEGDEHAAAPVLQWAWGDRDTQRYLQPDLHLPRSMAVHGEGRIYHRELPSRAPLMVKEADGRWRLGLHIEEALEDLYDEEERRRFEVRVRGVETVVTIDEIWPAPPTAVHQDGLAPPIAAARMGLQEQSSARLAAWWALQEFELAHRASGLGGAAWVDAAALPHQRAAAREVLTSPSVGHVLADEVGLGKTVEAAMVWSALRAQAPELATLVVAPSALLWQIRGEFLSRCGGAEQLRRSGAKDHWRSVRCVPYGAGGEDKLETANVVLVQPRDAGRILDALRASKRRLGLLIIDEFQELSAEQRSAIERLAERSAGVLALSATPRDVTRRFGAAARRRAEDAAFPWALAVTGGRALGATHDARREAVTARLARGAEAAALARSVGDLEEVCRRFEVQKSHTAEDPLRVLAREVAPFGRVVRTRREGLPEAKAERRLHAWAVQWRPEERAVFEALDPELEAEEQGQRDERASRRAASSWDALRGAYGADDEVRACLARLPRALDSKFEALLNLLAQLWASEPGRRVVIRAEYARTVQLLEERLAELLMEGGVRAASPAQLQAWRAARAGDGQGVGPVAALRRGQLTADEVWAALISPDSDERGRLDLLERQAAAFLDPGPAGAVVLVSDDAGMVGHNLQSASDLVLYDVPWRPQQAEQWIGRLDRLGRGGRPVDVHVLNGAPSPAAPLTAIYDALQIWTKPFSVNPDVEARIDRIMRRAEDGQVSWDKAEALVREEAGREASEEDALLRALEPDVAAARSALERERSEDATVEAGRRLLDAVRRLGVHMTERDGARVGLRLTDDSALGLRSLRVSGWKGKEKRPRRWARLRRAADAAEGLDRDDLLTPNHGLFLDLLDEMSRSVAPGFGVFEAEAADPQLRPLRGATIAIGLLRGAARAAASGALEGCGVYEVIEGRDDDEALWELIEGAELALARGLEVALPPRATVVGCQFSRGDVEPLSSAQVAAARRLLERDLPASREPPPETFELTLALEGFAAATPDAAALAEVDRFLTRQARYLRDAVGALVLDYRLRGERASEQARKGEEANVARMKEGQSRGLEAQAKRAEAALERLGALPGRAREIAAEAARPRLVAALVVELR